MEPTGPLLEAVRTDDAKTLQRLLAEGADPNAVTGNRFRMKALVTLAAEHGSASVLQVLLEAGAEHSPVTGFDWTPLRAAICEGQTEVVSVLLANGVELNPPNKRGSMLSEAVDATRHHPSPAAMHTLELLLQAGATVRAGDRPAIVSAVEHGASPAVLRLLIAHGHNPDELREDGTPLLVLAVRRRDHAAVDALIDAGASIDATDPEGRSPLMHAAEFGHVPIVASLLQAGAEPSHADGDGTTSMMLAKSWGRSTPQFMLGETFTRPESVDARRTMMDLKPQSFELRGSPSQFDLWSRIVAHTVDDLGDDEFGTLVDNAQDARHLAERLKTDGVPASEPVAWHVLDVSAQDVSIVRLCLLNLAYGPKMEMPAGLSQTDVCDLFEELMSQLYR